MTPWSVRALSRTPDVCPLTTMGVVGTGLACSRDCISSAPVRGEGSAWLHLCTLGLRVAYAEHHAVISWWIPACTLYREFLVYTVK